MDIYDAAIKGDVDSVKSALRYCPVASTDDGGRTPLHYAAQYGRKDVVELLLANGADVNATICHGFILGGTPLYYAAYNGEKAVVELLVAHGADPNVRDLASGGTPLHGAAGGGEKEVVEILLAGGANPNAEADDGRTPLHYAAGFLCSSIAGKVRCYKEVAELLVANGSDVNAKTKDGKTPLFLATARGRSDVAEVLIRHSGTSSPQPSGASQPPAPPQESQTASRPTETQSTSKSGYWKCPKCSALLQKGFGALLANTQVRGVGRCSNCGAEFDQNDIYDGRYDAEEKAINRDLKFRIVGSTAFWGDGHQVTYNNEYTPTELSWLLDGDLFPANSPMTEKECRDVVEGNFDAAFQVALRSCQEHNLPKPKNSDGYGLAITKFQLSFAVRNNVGFPEAIRIFKSTMRM